MKRIHTSYFVAIAFGIGLLIGVMMINHFCDKVQRTFEIRLAEDKTDLALRALINLREGTNAADFLEIRLDDGVINLGNILLKEPDTRWSPTDVNLLKNVRNYRQKFPRKQGVTELDGRVDNILSIIEHKTNY